MKDTRKAVLTAAILLSVFNMIHAQEGKTQAVRLYETWISVSNEAEELRGILYRINDSSIVIADSKIKNDYLTGNLMLTEIPAMDIDYVKTRQQNIVKTGAIIGSVIGLSAAIGIGIALEMAGAGGLGIIASIGIVPMAMAAGALLGMLVTGPAQNKTLINRNINDFSLYRDKLKQYSFIDRYYTDGSLSAYNPYTEFSRNKAYFNMSAGIALPFGNFPAEYLGMTSRGNINAGYNINLNIGYMITRRFSVSLSNVDYEFVFGNDVSSFYWGSGGFLANANYSFPAGEKTYLNIKSGAGPIWSFIDDEGDTDKEGAGAGLNASVAYAYVLSGRWSLQAETGYFCSFQNFEGSDIFIHTASISVGIEYRFIKK